MDVKARIAGMKFLSCWLMGVPVGMGADFEGKVVGVLEGDTIEVLHDKKTERIRLYGIDCPEKKVAAFRSKGKASDLLARLW